MEIAKRRMPCFKHPPLWHEATFYKNGGTIKPRDCPHHVVNIFFTRRQLTSLRSLIKESTTMDHVLLQQKVLNSKNRIETLLPPRRV
jgi:hypothetical protein